MKRATAVGEARFLACAQLASVPARQPYVYLGDWCFGASKDIQQHPACDVLAYPWTNRQFRLDALDYSVDLSFRAARGVGLFLSKRSGRNSNEREAVTLYAATIGRIVMGAYHDFICLREARDQFGPLTTAVLRKQEHVVPTTTTELMDFLRRDDFRLQMISELSKEAGIDLEEMSGTALKRLYAPLSAVASGAHARSRADTVIRGLAKRILLRLGRRAECVLYNPSFSVAETTVLALRSGLKVIHIPLLRLDQTPWPKPSPELRDELRHFMASFLRNDPFEQAFARVLSAVFPRSLVEGFEQLKAIVADYFPPNPKTIASGMAWNIDDAFRLWCANNVRVGARLVGGQHGGTYGHLESHDLGERVEYEVIDRFVSWGRARNLARSSICLPVPPHFLPRPRENPGGHLLYIATSIDRRPYSFANYPIGSMFLDYEARQIAFCRALDPIIRQRMLMRPNPSDGGWRQVARLRDLLPEVALDDFGRTFSKRLSAARLVVIDNMNTTFIQSMASGIPTVFVWDPEVFTANDVTAEYFEALEVAGVYFRSPEAAAQAIASIWPNPQKWWKSKKVADAVRSFVNYSANTDRNWVSPWLSELRQAR